MKLGIILTSSLALSALVLTTGCDQGSSLLIQDMSQRIDQCQARPHNSRPQIDLYRLDGCVSGLSSDERAQWLEDTLTCQEHVGCGEMVACLRSVEICPITVAEPTRTITIKMPKRPTYTPDARIRDRVNPNPARQETLPFNPTAMSDKAFSERRALGTKRVERRNPTAMSDAEFNRRRAFAAKRVERRNPTAMRDAEFNRRRAFTAKGLRPTLKSDTRLAECSARCGDVNNDGKVSGADARLLMAIVRGNGALNADQRLCMPEQSDVNGDGSLTLRDVVDLYAFLDGTRNQLFCER